MGGTPRFHYPATVGGKFCLFCLSPKIFSTVTDPSLPSVREFLEVLEMCLPRPIYYYHDLSKKNSSRRETKFSNLQKKVPHLTNFSLQVFPGLLQCLPLKEDFEENHPVYSCIMELFSDQHPLIRQYLPQLLAVFSQVLPSGSLQDGE